MLFTYENSWFFVCCKRRERTHTQLSVWISFSEQWQCNIRRCETIVKIFQQLFGSLILQCSKFVVFFLLLGESDELGMFAKRNERRRRKRQIHCNKIHCFQLNIFFWWWCCCCCYSVVYLHKWLNGLPPYFFFFLCDRATVKERKRYKNKSKAIATPKWNACTSRRVLNKRERRQKKEFMLCMHTHSNCIYIQTGHTGSPWELIHIGF